MSEAPCPCPAADSLSFFLPSLPRPPGRFRSKYHPDEAGRRKQDAQGALQNRLRVFLYLLDNAWFDTLLLDMDKASAIIKTLDAGTGGAGGSLSFST